MDCYDSVHLQMLRVDLGLASVTTEQELYLRTLIDAAQRSIAGEGIRLDASRPDDDLLVVMYAAWLYRKRAQAPDAQAMPRMLRWQLNCRLTGQKMEADE